MPQLTNSCTQLIPSAMTPLVKEKADAPAEGRAVLGVEVHLVQHGQAKDSLRVAT